MKISSGIKALIISLLILSLPGCALLGATCAFLGTPIKTLQQEKIKYTKVVDKDIDYCYKNTLDLLKDWKAVVYDKKDKLYIAAICFNKVFNNCIDTTEVAFFFKEIEANKTEIEVSSLNHRLSNFASQKLFEHLGNPNAPPVPFIADKASITLKKSAKGQNIS